MGLVSKTGTFLLRTATGNQPIRPPGLNFTPVLWEFFPTNQIAEGIGVHVQLGWGAAMNSSAMFAISSNSENGQGTSDATNITTDDKCFVLLNPGLTTVLYNAEFVNSEFGGCTINVITAPSSQFVVGFRAWGGSSIEAFIGTFTTKGSAGSDTFSGIPFKPEYLKFGTTRRTTIPSSGNEGIFAIGETSGVGEEGAVVVTSQNAQGTSNTKRKQRDDRCILAMNVSGTGIEDAIFEAFTADGFIVDWQNGSNALKIPFIAMRGGQFQVGSFLSQTAAGEFAAIEDLDFRPKTGSFFSFHNPETNSNVDGLKFSIGIADIVVDDINASGRFVAGATDEDAQGTTDADNFFDPGSFYKPYDFNQNILGDIDFVQWNSGGMTADETDADSAANEIIYMVAGDPTGKDNTQPAKVTYSMRVRDNMQVIREIETGRVVEPEEVKVNTYLRIEDLLPHVLPRESDLARDPQITFIESVIVQPPFGIALAGLRSTQADVFFSGMGLGGTSQT